MPCLLWGRAVPVTTQRLGILGDADMGQFECWKPLIFTIIHSKSYFGWFWNILMWYSCRETGTIQYVGPECLVSSWIAGAVFIKNWYQGYSAISTPSLPEHVFWNTMYQWQLSIFLACIDSFFRAFSAYPVRHWSKMEGILVHVFEH